MLIKKWQPETSSTCHVGHRDAAVHDILLCIMVESLKYHKSVSQFCA